MMALISPTIVVDLIKRLALRFARGKSLAPICFPSRIAPPYAIPKNSTLVRSRIVDITEFAATISSPMWPSITEYVAQAAPQTNSFPIAGSEYFRKSRVRSLSLHKIAEKLSLTSFIRLEMRMLIKTSVILEIEVARATPKRPSFGAPKSPNIKTAFRKMFNPNAKKVIQVTVFTCSRLFNKA